MISLIRISGVRLNSMIKTYISSPLLVLVLIAAMAVTNACAVEPYGFQGVIITDADGKQKNDFKPGDAVRYEAVFTLDAPGAAIIRGAVSGANWSDVLDARIRIGLKAIYNVSWTDSIPFSARGQTTVDVILYSPLLRERLIRTGFFTVTPIQADYVGSDTCSTCHKALYDAWKETRHATAVGCESCHGPASEHVRTVSPEFIVVDTTPDVCKQCHSRNDGAVIEAEGGFIKTMQQYNEWRSTAHGRVAACAVCHNPHYSVSKDRKNAIKTSCIDCHGNKSVSLNMQTLACENCHMPNAVLTTEATGSGNYRKGDTPSHLWRIKTEANPGDMFTSDGKAAMQDGRGSFLTLNFSCLGCHNGRDARFESFESVQQTSTLVH